MHSIGSVAVVFGKRGDTFPIGALDVTEGGAGFVITHDDPNANDFGGLDIAEISGDFNGDGFNDVVFNRSREVQDPYLTPEHLTFVVLGRGELASFSTDELGVADSRGVVVRGSLSTAIVVGDQNADGADDLLTMARGVEILFGRDDVVGISLDDALDTGGAVQLSEDPRFLAATGGADINGDGVLDFALTGGPADDHVHSRVVFGGSFGS